jgi:hypothetical protein
MEENPAKTEQQYIVRSFNTSDPSHGAISPPTSKAEAEKLARQFKADNFYHEAWIEPYTNQKIGPY